MNSLDVTNELDPFGENPLEKMPIETGYSIVASTDLRDAGRIGALSEQCGKCGKQAIVTDAVLWRETGAGITCDQCARQPVGTIVADLTCERLRVDPDRRVEIPPWLRHSQELAGAERLELHAQAYSMAKDIVHQGSDNPWPYIWLGLLESKKRGVESSKWLPLFDKARQLSPNNARVIAWWGLMHARIPTNESAVLESMEQALSLDPDYLDAYVYLAAFAGVRYPDVCEKTLRLAIERFPDNDRIKRMCRIYGVSTPT